MDQLNSFLKLMICGKIPCSGENREMFRGKQGFLTLNKEFPSDEAATGRVSTVPVFTS
jgi:hypothetical protein